MDIVLGFHGQGVACQNNTESSSKAVELFEPDLLCLEVPLDFTCYS